MRAAPEEAPLFGTLPTNLASGLVPCAHRCIRQAFGKPPRDSPQLQANPVDQKRVPSRGRQAQQA